MKHKNIALLGATGFLGQKVLSDLVDNGYRVTVISRSAIRYSIPYSVEVVTIKQFLSCQIKFDFIINCAGYYSKSTTFSEIYKIRKNNYILIKKLNRFREKKGGSLITFGSYFEQIPSCRETPANFYTKYKIKGKKLLNKSAEIISYPTFYIYLFDTYGEEDNRNKVLTYIIDEFKVGRIPKLTNPLGFVNWTHKSDISASVINLVNNSEEFLPYKLHEFQIRSLDEFRLVDFIHIISRKTNPYGSDYYENSSRSNLVDCAPNLPFFRARNSVLDFTLNSIQQK
jgi:nucleoside-diphosphate-sugar epimerase